MVLKADPGAWTAFAVVVGSTARPDVDGLRRRIDEDAEHLGGAVSAARLPRLHPERAADALAC